MYSTLTSTSGSLVVRTACAESQEAFEKATQRRIVPQFESRCENDNARRQFRVFDKSIVKSKDAVNDGEEHLDSKIQT